jgi:3-oxoacyl-[acyl-carrier protein] reductase
VIGITKALAKEVAPSGIRVNCVAPGVVMTDMLSCFDENTLDELKEETPLGKLGTPKDIADAVAFLASDKAQFITGQVMGVNGGFVI